MPFPSLFIFYLLLYKKIFLLIHSIFTLAPRAMAYRFVCKLKKEIKHEKETSIPFLTDDKDVLPICRCTD